MQNNLSTDISEKFRVRFEDVGNPGGVPYDGTPFVILARYERYCLFGNDKHRKKKIKQKEEIDLFKVNFKLNITSINRMVSLEIKCEYMRFCQYSLGIPLLEIRMSSSFAVRYII